MKNRTDENCLIFSISGMTWGIRIKTPMPTINSAVPQINWIFDLPSIWFIRLIIINYKKKIGGSVSVQKITVNVSDNRILNLDIPQCINFN